MLCIENTEEIFICDLAVEMKNFGDLKEAIALCEQVSDYVSRQILTSILDDTEEHIDWNETQQRLISQIGIENYIAENMGGDGE